MLQYSNAGNSNHSEDEQLNKASNLSQANLFHLQAK